MPPVAIRREGFTGQHLVVVPAPVRRTASRHPLLRGLLVTDAGFFPTATGHRVERPQGAATHLMMICLRGAGWVRSGNREVSVEAGECVWLPANVSHAYGADEGDPWTLVYAHFAGDEVSHWRIELGWAGREPFGVFRFSARGGMPMGLDRVYAILETGYSIDHLLSASAALRAVFCTCLEASKSAGAVKTAVERTAAVRDEIVASPTRHYRLQELAASAGLSIPHFSTLFRKQTGFAPIDFLIRQRIRKACRLLDATTHSVAEIAEQSGFDDPYYFSRCFHRVMGSSPREYRKSVKG